MKPSEHPIHQSVRKAYGQVASQKSGCCGPNSACCGSGRALDVALGLGYSELELSTLPDGANLGLSCGNPMAFGELRPGETVLDLGSGAGFDVFLAAQRVGSTGKVHGVDMTPEMLDRARGNAKAFTERTGLSNVEFHHGQIEAIPLPDESVDVVLSNCVINLSPDQPMVWKEVARVLKPGGRVSISDMALFNALPENLRRSVEAHVGCIAGAPLLSDLQAMIEAAGLEHVEILHKKGAVEAMFQGDDALSVQTLMPKSQALEDLIGSFIIQAKKPE